MKYLKHWELELSISFISLIVIAFSYFLLGSFFTQLIFVPFLFAILPLCLVQRYKLLFCYPLEASVIYALFLLMMSPWPINWNLIPMALITTLIPTVIGYLIGFFLLLFLKPDQKWLIPIHLLSAVLIVVFSLAGYASLIPSSFYYLRFYLFLPLVFMGSQAVISFLYPSNRLSPLVNACIFLVINFFIFSKSMIHLLILYVLLSYATLYLVRKIGKSTSSDKK